MRASEEDRADVGKPRQITRAIARGDSVPEAQ